MENEARRALWKASRRFRIKDRIYLLSGPVGIVLLFADWRIGLAVLLFGVPLLYGWKERELARHSSFYRLDPTGYQDDLYSNGRSEQTRCEAS